MATSDFAKTIDNCSSSSSSKTGHLLLPHNPTNDTNSNACLSAAGGDGSSATAPAGAEIDLKWRRFAEWMHCICVVTFDLELGQAMEVIN